jgi:predicted DNA-binding protein
MNPKLQSEIVSFRMSDIIKTKLNKLAGIEGMSLAAYMRHWISIEYDKKVKN